MHKISFSDDSSSSNYSNDDDVVFNLPKAKPPLPNARKCNSARAIPNRILMNKPIRPNLNKSKDDNILSQMSTSDVSQDMHSSSTAAEHSNEETSKEHQGKKKIKRRVYKKPLNETKPDSNPVNQDRAQPPPNLSQSSTSKRKPSTTQNPNSDSSNHQVAEQTKTQKVVNDEKVRSAQSNDTRPSKNYKIPPLPINSVNEFPSGPKSASSKPPERGSEPVKVRRKVRKVKLAVSNPSSITFYFDSPLPAQPHSGILKATIDNMPFTPSFVTGNLPPTPSESHKPPILNFQVRNPLMFTKDSEVNDDENNYDNSIKHAALNKAFMSTAVFNNLMEQNSIPNEEMKEAIRQSQTDNLAMQINRVPTLAAFEQNASGNLDLSTTENSVKPAIAFSRSFFKIADDSHDLTMKTRQELLKQVHMSRPIGLNEISQDMIQETSPSFKQISNQYDDMSNNPQFLASQRRDDFLDYKLTTIRNPPSSDIITEEQNGYTYINEISVDAFKKLQFGSTITDPNPDQLHIFAWHNLKIDPCEIIKSLYDFVNSLSNNESDLDKIKSIIQYLLIWLYYFAIDFRENEKCAKMLRSVLNKLLDKSSNNNNQETTITREICLLKSCIKSISDKTSSPEDFSLSALSKPILTSNISNQSVNIIDCTIDPAVLVRHFSYIELNIIKSIQRYEIMKFINEKIIALEDKKKFLPNYTEYFLRFNQTAVFIATSILVDGAKHRGKRIEYWIKVMDEAKKFRNFLLIYEIDAALASFPISRLENTWKRIGKKYINILNHLHEMTAPISSAIVMYKKLVKQNPEKTIPYIGPFLSELKYIDEVKKIKTTLPNGHDAYNIRFQRSYANILETIFLDWGSKIRFQIDMNLLQKCKDLDGRKEKTEDLMLPSRIFEP